MKNRIIVGMTGATGSVLCFRMLETLAKLSIESHLVITEWAERTMKIETERTVAELYELADFTYRNDNQAAALGSGSFPADGMIIVPCSMNTLASLAIGATPNLLTRAALVTLKEKQRTLAIVARETPMNSICLRNLLTLAEAGAVIVPPMLTFYNHPESIDHMVDHIVGRTLDQFGIENDLTPRWSEDGRGTSTRRTDSLRNQE